MLVVPPFYSYVSFSTIAIYCDLVFGSVLGCGGGRVDSWHSLIQCCYESLSSHSGQADWSLQSAAVCVAYAWLPMCQCSSYISLALCDACDRDDLRTSHICAASAGVVSVHRGGRGIVSLALYLTHFRRYFYKNFMFLSQ